MENNLVKLQEGINLLLSRWASLQLAVQNEFGGRDSARKAEQLPADIFSWFIQSKEPLYIDDLEELLDEFMLSLNTEIDDGSVEEIAEKLMVMHEECLAGNFSSVEMLKQSNPPRFSAQAVNGNGDRDDDSISEDEEMVVDSQECQFNLTEKDVAADEPMQTETETPAAEDGWTVVQPKRNRGEKHSVVIWEANYTNIKGVHITEVTPLPNPVCLHLC